MPNYRRAYQRNFRRRRPLKRKRKYRRTKTTYSRRSKRLRAKVVRGRRKMTLSKRVKALEGVTARHWDTVDLGVGGVSREFRINWNGCEWIDGTQPPGPGFVLRQAMAIARASDDGTLPATTPFFPATTDNVATSARIFANKLRICGRLRAPISEPAISPAAPGYGLSLANIQAITTCKIWMVVLQDRIPGTTDMNGQMAVNTLPDNEAVPLPPGVVPSFEGPLEAQFQVLRPGTAAAVNTLELYGMQGALRNYSKSRFKIVHKQAFTLSQAHPQKDFKVEIKLNKYIQYPELTSLASTSLPTSNSYYVTFCTAWEDFLGSEESNTGDGTNNFPLVSGLSSRLYYKDA